MKCFDCKKSPPECECDHPVVVLGPSMGRRYHLRTEDENDTIRLICCLVGIAVLFAVVCQLVS